MEPLTDDEQAMCHHDETVQIIDGVDDLVTLVLDHCLTCGAELLVDMAWSPKAHPGVMDPR